MFVGFGRLNKLIGGTMGSTAPFVGGVGTINRRSVEGYGIPTSATAKWLMHWDQTNAVAGGAYDGAIWGPMPEFFFEDGDP